MFRKLLLLMLVCVGIVGCGGHSEDEWQAQLAKYGDLSKKYSTQEGELAKAKGRVNELTKQLEDMGVKVKDLDQIRAALEDYKQRAAMLEKIKARFEALRDKLKKLTDLGLKVEIRHNRMIISLPGDVLFASGKDDLRVDGKTILRQVADVIRGDASLAGRQYQVAGHTDNKPLVATAGMYKDNWGLSVMRARSVLVYLTSAQDSKAGGGSLDSTHWSASGYGDTDPVADNSTDDGRQKNRRVELILLPDVEEMLDLRSFI